MLQYLSVGENYLSFLPEVDIDFDPLKSFKYKLLSCFSHPGDWVIGGP